MSMMEKNEDEKLSFARMSSGAGSMWNDSNNTAAGTYKSVPWSLIVIRVTGKSSKYDNKQFYELKKTF